jgi:hypothetical protein
MKQATFFCENCGKPVPLDAEECPHCGSRFTAVHCPKCSFVGKATLFTAGCPRCGFLSSAPTERNSRAEKREAPLGRREKGSLRLGACRGGTSHLPGWFYTVASILLLIALVGLFVIIIGLK